MSAFSYMKVNYLITVCFYNNKSPIYIFALIYENKGIFYTKDTLRILFSNEIASIWSPNRCIIYKGIFNIRKLSVKRILWTFFFHYTSNSKIFLLVNSNTFISIKWIRVRRKVKIKEKCSQRRKLRERNCNWINYKLIQFNV